MNYKKYITEETMGKTVAKGILKKSRSKIGDTIFFVENQLKLAKGGRAAKDMRDPEMDKAIQMLEKWVKILKGIK